jgi:aminoglycoside phosphotransferase (APT) family kinase protein
VTVQDPQRADTVNVGERLAVGSRSIVFAADDDSVLKVPVPGTPPSWIVAESLYCDAAHAVGAPVPRMLGLFTVGNSPAIKFERVRGTSMWERVAADPSSAHAAGTLLAEVHIGLRSHTVPLVLPEMRSRMLAKLHLARTHFGGVFEDVVAVLETEWASSAKLSLCHGDLHPKNVLESVGGPVLVDWFDASRGSWIADVARTSLLLDLGHTAGTIESASPSWLGRIHDGYLERIRVDAAFHETSFARWRVVNAAARLAEGLQIDLTRSLLTRELAALRG